MLFRNVGENLLCNPAMGAYSQLHEVHIDFECVVVVGSDVLREVPPPMLSRFEKYSLTMEDCMKARLLSGLEVLQPVRGIKVRDVHSTVGKLAIFSA